MSVKETKNQVKNFDYVYKLERLHKDALIFLDRVKVQKSTINSLEAEQRNREFLKLQRDPVTAYHILLAKRRVKILERSYNKILDQIKLA